MGRYLQLSRILHAHAHAHAQTGDRERHSLDRVLTVRAQVLSCLERTAAELPRNQLQVLASESASLDARTLLAMGVTRRDAIRVRQPLDQRV